MGGQIFRGGLSKNRHFPTAVPLVPTTNCRAGADDADPSGGGGYIIMSLLSSVHAANLIRFFCPCTSDSYTSQAEAQRRAINITRRLKRAFRCHARYDDVQRQEKVGCYNIMTCRYTGQGTQRTLCTDPWRTDDRHLKHSFPSSSSSSLLSLAGCRHSTARRNVVVHRDTFWGRNSLLIFAPYTPKYVLNQRPESMVTGIASTSEHIAAFKLRPRCAPWF